MQYDLALQWRSGTKRQFADVLSRSHGNRTRGTNVDDSSPGDSMTKGTYRGPRGPVLDGIPLGQLIIEDTNNNGALPLTILAAVPFTTDLKQVDTNPVGHRSRVHSLDPTSTLPKAVVIGCGGGGCIRALENILDFTGVTGHDRRALECARANGMETSAMWKRTSLGDPEYGFWVKPLKPEAIIESHPGGPASWIRKDQRARQEQPLPLFKPSFPLTLTL